MQHPLRTGPLYGAVLAIGLATAVPAHAAKASQCEQEKPASLAMLKIGGLFSAMEKVCHNKSDAELADRKQKSIASLKKETCITSAEFNTAYDAGFKETEAMMQKASASERAKECKEFDTLKSKKK